MTTKQTARKAVPARRAGATSADHAELFSVALTDAISAQNARFRAVATMATACLAHERAAYIAAHDASAWKSLDTVKVLKMIQARAKNWTDSHHLIASLSDSQIKDLRVELNAALIVAFSGADPAKVGTRKGLLDAAKQVRESLGIGRKSNSAGNASAKKTTSNGDESAAQEMDLARALDMVEQAIKGKNPQAVGRFREWLDRYPYLTQ